MGDIKWTQDEQERVLDALPDSYMKARIDFDPEKASPQDMENMLDKQDELIFSLQLGSLSIERMFKLTTDLLEQSNKELEANLEKYEISTDLQAKYNGLLRDFNYETEQLSIWQKRAWEAESKVLEFEQLNSDVTGKRNDNKGQAKSNTAKVQIDKVAYDSFVEKFNKLKKQNREAASQNKATEEKVRAPKAKAPKATAENVGKTKSRIPVFVKPTNTEPVVSGNHTKVNNANTTKITSDSSRLSTHKSAIPRPIRQAEPAPKPQPISKPGIIRSTAIEKKRPPWNNSKARQWGWSAPQNVADKSAFTRVKKLPPIKPANRRKPQQISPVPHSHGNANAGASPVQAEDTPASTASTNSLKPEDYYHPPPYISGSQIPLPLGHNRRAQSIGNIYTNNRTVRTTPNPDRPVRTSLRPRPPAGPPPENRRVSKYQKK